MTRTSRSRRFRSPARFRANGAARGPSPAEGRPPAGGGGGGGGGPRDGGRRAPSTPRVAPARGGSETRHSRDGPGARGGGAGRPRPAPPPAREGEGFGDAPGGGVGCGTWLAL